MCYIQDTFLSFFFFGGGVDKPLAEDAVSLF